MRYAKIERANSPGTYGFKDMSGLKINFISRHLARQTRALLMQRDRKEPLLRGYNFENKRIEGADNLTRWVPRTPRGVNTICKCGNCTRHNKGD